MRTCHTSNGVRSTRPALILVHETGHRIDAVRMLRWSDTDLDRGTARWRAEHDKIGFEHIPPLSEAAVEALRRVRRSQAVIGDARAFSSPKDAAKPCSRNIMRDWWQEARESAGLSAVHSLGWHSLRRKFACELKETPLKDLCEFGGWKSPQTVIRV